MMTNIVFLAHLPHDKERKRERGWFRTGHIFMQLALVNT